MAGEETDSLTWSPVLGKISRAWARGWYYAEYVLAWWAGDWAGPQMRYCSAPRPCCPPCGRERWARQGTWGGVQRGHRPRRRLQVMAGASGEPGGLLRRRGREGLGVLDGQGPAWPCSGASPATGSVWKGEERGTGECGPGWAAWTHAWRAGPAQAAPNREFRPFTALPTQGPLPERQKGLRTL